MQIIKHPPKLKVAEVWDMAERRTEDGARLVGSAEGPVNPDLNQE